MSSLTRADAQGLCNFVDLSPSPFHVCATVAAMLADADFDELTETQPWPTEPGRYYVIRGGSLIAFPATAEEASFLIKNNVIDIDDALYTGTPGPYVRFEGNRNEILSADPFNGVVQLVAGRLDGGTDRIGWPDFSFRAGTAKVDVTAGTHDYVGDGSGTWYVTVDSAGTVTPNSATVSTMMKICR